MVNSSTDVNSSISGVSAGTVTSAGVVSISGFVTAVSDDTGSVCLSGLTDAGFVSPVLPEVVKSSVLSLSLTISVICLVRWFRMSQPGLRVILYSPALSRLYFPVIYT